MHIIITICVETKRKEFAPDLYMYRLSTFRRPKTLFIYYNLFVNKHCKKNVNYSNMGIKAINKK